MSNYKSEITVHINTLLIETLTKTTKDVNAYIDEVLSNYFGIAYEEAYPDCSEGRWLGVFNNGH